MSFNRDKLSLIPKKPGVYLMKDKHQKVLYVGKANSLYIRVRQYFLSSSDLRAMIPFLLKKIESIETIITFNEKEALLLERSLIQKHQPPYNVILKDDKNFIGIEINPTESFPTIKMSRYDSHNKKSHFFGPYTSSKGARVLFDFLKQNFNLRKCTLHELKNRKTPCIYYDMRQCSAPCVDLCTKEEYQKDVDSTLHFLQGKNKEPLMQLKVKREQASKSLKFEKAHALHEKILLINRLLSEKQFQTLSSRKLATDIFNFHHNDDLLALVKLTYRNKKLEELTKYHFKLNLSTPLEIMQSFLMQHYQSFPLPKEILLPKLFHQQTDPLAEALSKTVSIHIPVKGEKKKHIDLAFINAETYLEQCRKGKELSNNILFDLKEILNLSAIPMHIECFDTSHTMQHIPVGSKSVFINGIKSGKLCRRYHIKKAADDITMLHEIIKRSLIRAQKEDHLPNLIIIDGGKGHLNMLTSLVEKLNLVSIDCIAIAKENSRHDSGLTKEKIYLKTSSSPLILSSYSTLLMFLQTIRDEAHKIAITFHRKSSRKKMSHSKLDAIPGIGPTKKKRLLSYFKSVHAITEATDNELIKVQSITKTDVKNIRKFSQ